MRLKEMLQELLEGFQEKIPKEKWKIDSKDIETIFEDFSKHFETNVSLKILSEEDRKVLFRFIKRYIKNYLSVYPDDRIKLLQRLGERLLIKLISEFSVVEVYKIILRAVEKIKDESKREILKEKINFDFIIVISLYINLSYKEDKKILKDSSLEYVLSVEKGINIHLNIKNKLYKSLFSGKNQVEIKSAEECEFSEWLKDSLIDLVNDKNIIKEIESLHEKFHLIAQKILKGKDNFTKVLLLRDLEDASLKLIYLLNKIYTENLSHIAIYDKLTQVYNRVLLDSILYKLAKYSKRHKLPISIIMLDIDNFKGINDTYGHLEGDRVLKVVASIIKSSIRESDYIFRYGGEEFLTLLPNTDINGAVVVGEKIRRNIENFDFGLDRKITISCGIKQIENFDNPYLDIEEADKYLYVAKKTGKNRCIYGNIILTS
ncbi:sensor domain-containing diguanylate cyclase [Sulfurihydrogenibium sp.]|jgi:diguanylate cyclase (GGDEF)-like protein|uniref:sensor domain-containing diguanylate cyclase n=1 Tax=Sulfurihydrogenibium sp. TaxID=2053621 RepID=UPI002636321F|nr:sensor domain-containing diguanylate cyclase [Sulfurihydrogenibium sp.]